MPKLLLLLSLLLVPFSGKGQMGANSVWARPTIPLIFNVKHQVGDILFDPTQDRADFALRPGGSIYQYYNFNTSYAGGRLELRRILRETLRQLPVSGTDSGYLTLRFVVNFKGETDRFRMSALNFNYQPLEFAPELVAQVLHACQQLRDWVPGQINGQTKDSYFYITFVVRDGRVQDITL